MENNKINLNPSMSKPLWSLTQEEFVELHKSCLTDVLKAVISGEIKTAKEEAIPKTDTMGLEETAALTGYVPETLYAKVCKRQIPRLSTGRPLIFSRKEITLWLKLDKPTVAEMAFMRRNGEI